MDGRKHILIMGRPGIGKTTALRRVLEGLDPQRVSGFYTEEIRAGGSRRGFKVKTLDGKEGLLAHVDVQGGPRVGKYGIDVRGFERIALRVIDPRRVRADVIVIDEIGKMECLSEAFEGCVGEILTSHKMLVGTVAQRGGGLIEEIKGREDIAIFELTPKNREVLVQRIRAKLRELNIGFRCAK